MSYDGVVWYIGSTHKAGYILRNAGVTLELTMHPNPKVGRVRGLF